jgi:hypothetical protein
MENRKRGSASFTCTGLVEIMECDYCSNDAKYEVVLAESGLILVACLDCLISCIKENVTTKDYVDSIEEICSPQNEQINDEKKV